MDNLLELPWFFLSITSQTPGVKPSTTSTCISWCDADWSVKCVRNTTSLNSCVIWLVQPPHKLRSVAMFHFSKTVNGQAARHGLVYVWFALKEIFQGLKDAVFACISHPERPLQLFQVVGHVMVATRSLYLNHSGGVGVFGVTARSWKAHNSWAVR